MNIISKFTVGSEQGIDLLFELREVQLKEMYANILDPEKLQIFIKNEFNRRITINQLNDLSTQLIIVHEKEKALGYAILKNSFNNPEILKDKKTVQLSFFVLRDYQTPEVFNSLWEKCLSVTRNYSHWIEVIQNHSTIPILESFGFKISAQSELKPFNLPSYIMVRKN